MDAELPITSPLRWKEIHNGRDLGCHGVFALVHTPTGKRYISAAQNVAKCLWHHRWLLRKGRHFNPDLQSDYDRDGPTAFCAYLILRGWGLLDDPSGIQQRLIDEAAAQGLSYNRKSAVAKNPRPRRQPPIQVGQIAVAAPPGPAPIPNGADQIQADIEAALDGLRGLARSKALLRIIQERLQSP